MSATGDVVRLVNEIRAAHGLHPLTGNVRLARAALRRATTCARKGRISHAGWVDAFKAVRWPWRRHEIGENLGQGQERAAEVVRDWMASPTHRDNILNPRFRRIGVGVAEGHGDRFWAQAFSS